MRKTKVTPATNLDKNGLDPTSVKFASFFYLNNYDVDIISDKFIKILNQHHSQKLSGNQILESFHVNYLPLFELIFKVYFSTYLTWNEYFQFIIFFCFAPNVAVFYLILHTLPDFKDVVTWKDIQKLIQQLRKEEDIDSQATTVYKKIDVNNHGYISLNQFFKFVIETPSIWEPIYLFRLSLIDGIFNHTQLFTIMKRRVRIPFIKDYLSKHGKYQSQNCLSVIKRFILGQPHPDHFEYDGGLASSSSNGNTTGIVGTNVIVGSSNRSSSLIDYNLNTNGATTTTTMTTPPIHNRNLQNNQVVTSSPTRFSYLNNNNNNQSGISNNGDYITSFSGIASIIIKKFKPDYTPRKHDAFAMKYLSQFNQFTVLAQIDSFYITYRSLNPVSVKSIIIRSQNHSLVTGNNASSFSHYVNESSNRRSSSTGGDSTSTTTTPLQSQGRHLQRPSILRRSNRLSVINNNNNSMLSVNGETTGRKLTATPVFLGHGRHLSIQSKQRMILTNGTLHVNASSKSKQPLSIPEKNEIGDLDEEEENLLHSSLPLDLDLNDETPV